MDLLQRNQLVWLQPQAWQEILSAAWDTQAQEVLRHWARAALPLVVARQRSGVALGRICVGLPAPARWERRRLALDVDSGDVSKIGFFPMLSGVLPGSLPTALSKVQLRVYGSHGWQSITGMAYLHGASDIDVLWHARTLTDAFNTAKAVNNWSAPYRTDGEVVFPSGHAVAWRELLQAHTGAVEQVLVKHRQSSCLMTLPALERLIGALGHAQVGTAGDRLVAAECPA